MLNLIWNCWPMNTGLIRLNGKTYNNGFSLDFISCYSHMTSLVQPQPSERLYIFYSNFHSSSINATEIYPDWIFCPIDTGVCCHQLDKWWGAKLRKTLIPSNMYQVVSALLGAEYGPCHHVWVSCDPISQMYETSGNVIILVVAKEWVTRLCAIWSNIIQGATAVL